MNWYEVYNEIDYLHRHHGDCITAISIHRGYVILFYEDFGRINWYTNTIPVLCSVFAFQGIAFYSEQGNERIAS